MSKLLFLGDFVYDYNTINSDIISLGEFIYSKKYTVILNLEAPLKGNFDKPIKKQFNLYNSGALIEVLKLLNVKTVNIANNHILDWGAGGLNQLIELLNHEKIGYFGAGTNLKNAVNPDIIEINQKKIAFLGFGWDVEKCIIAQTEKSGVAPVDTKMIINQIKQIRSKVNFLVIIFHWGYEYEKYPLPVHRELAHICIDNGADLIIGHHPHIIQAFEKYKGKNIFYSLGNFYFGKMRHDFFYCNKNSYIRENSSIGLGVIWDTGLNEISRIFFSSNSDSTSVMKKDIEIPDISNIDIKNYNEFYKKNRIAICRRPNLYIGSLNSYLNPIKLKISDIHIYSVKKIVIILKKMGIHSHLKREKK